MLGKASFCRLSLAFDASSLLTDLARISTPGWGAHFNAEYHDGWTGLALRAVAGSAVALYPEPVPQAAYADTPLLAALPAFAHALARFHCPLQSARLLRLAPGSRIREHRDYGLGFEQGVIRLHVPLETGPDVEFYLDGARVAMGVGECWYLDFARPHRVQNNGPTDRIHLVLDCEVNDWLLSRFPDDAESEVQRLSPQMAEAASVSSQRQLENFCALVLRDAGLRESFRQEEHADRFVDLVVEIGSRHGFRFTADDVGAVMQAARRTWFERSLVS
ncbi:MAG TPA: aspartyl/asparaginyl beta-hydroxylase domain-containing protein [Aliidongia sp.]|uniref:aspartyl/asparaginyl beta-hydroxylase domain-containing protein n=1 Tax=Aliidongia sp. TaxID=1914230 RepID=UPI002DDCA835|nr:aspartyl/asparaginyl beta-hydroxylase domain-containing protein [Aliidongia sp.]HEV2674549.1 aspartyl/asparaginyl beta-hydroxylase domain-containing protein [Aliidongia sp.]